MATRTGTVKLNETAYDFARRLIDEGKVVRDDRDM